MKWPSFLLLISMMPYALSAAENNFLTLEQAKALALENHPRIAAAELNVKAAGEALKQERAGYLPQIGANMVGAFADDGTRIAASSGLNNSSIIEHGSAGVSLSQLITDFGKTDNMVESSKSLLESEKSRSEAAREAILLSVIHSYYNLLKAQSTLKVANDTLKARNTLLEQIASLHESHIKSDLDLSIAKQGAEDAELLLIKANSAVDEAMAALSESLGLKEEKKFEVDDKIAINPLPQQEQFMANISDRLPDIKALKMQAEAAGKSAAAEKAANYPTVTALAFAGENPLRESDSALDSNYSAAGINISLPIFTGGRLTANEKKAGYKAEAAEEELRERQNTAARDVRMAWNNADTAYKNIEVTHQLLSNAMQTLDLTEERYNIGKSSIVDLNQASLNKTEAEIFYSNSIYDYLIRRGDLDYSAGISLTENQR